MAVMSSEMLFLGILTFGMGVLSQKVWGFSGAASTVANCQCPSLRDHGADGLMLVYQSLVWANGLARGQRDRCLVFVSSVKALQNAEASLVDAVSQGVDFAGEVVVSNNRQCRRTDTQSGVDKRL